MFGAFFVVNTNPPQLVNKSFQSTPLVKARCAVFRFFRIARKPGFIETLRLLRILREAWNFFQKNTATPLRKNPFQRGLWGKNNQNVGKKSPKSLFHTLQKVIGSRRSPGKTGDHTPFSDLLSLYASVFLPVGRVSTPSQPASWKEKVERERL